MGCWRRKSRGAVFGSGGGVGVQTDHYLVSAKLHVIRDCMHIKWNYDPMQLSYSIIPVINLNTENIPICSISKLQLPEEVVGGK